MPQHAPAAAVERPYRSKVYRPCDRCRRRKTACALPAEGPCRSCAAAKLVCAFEMPPAKRQRSVASGTTTATTPTQTPRQRSPLQLTGHRPTPGATAGSSVVVGGSSPRGSSSPGSIVVATHGRGGLVAGAKARDGGSAAAAAAAVLADMTADLTADLTADRTADRTAEGMAAYRDPDPLSPPALAVQHVCSLDQLDQAAAQLCGMSAELDPWLLRHCRFNEFGMRRLHNTHIRNVGGVPLLGLVPVHFTVAAGDSRGVYGGGPGAAADPRARQPDLDRLVPPAHGPKLVALFLRFVHPMMPVVSRSQLRQQLAAGTVPTLLLAALYASALPYVVHAPALFIGGVGHGLGAADDSSHAALGDALWRLVSDQVQAELAAPKLVVLQASLLYLQRLPPRRQWALGESPVRLSFLGSTIALAMSLGLQLEPQPWGIPAWEKRLRRCLWWAVYAEDKWTSLLLGRPPLIRASEWDVLELHAADLEPDVRLDAVLGALGVPATMLPPPPPPDLGAIFLAFAQLARLAEGIQDTFYSLRASQILAEDFRASIDAARPIRAALQAWYTKLSPALRLQSRPGSGDPYYHGRAQGVAALHFCYLTLELFLYRAILRPLARSPPPPPIFPERGAAGDGGEGEGEGDSGDDKTPPATASDGGDAAPWVLDDLTLLYNIELDQLPVVDFAELGAAAEATLNAAAKCAGFIVNFVATLVSSDFDVLWYPWARICFATITNFIVLLLVQAPSPWHAARAKELLDRWAVYLQRQHKSHESLMTLGLVRLHSMQVEELDRMFMLSGPAMEVLRGG